MVYSKGGTIMNQEDKCNWEIDDDGIYETGCANAFFCDSGTIVENDFVFCPYCGKPIKEIEEKQ